MKGGSKKRARPSINEEGPYTYCDGPVLVTKAVITNKTIVALIDALAERFGDGYVFEPEPIVEGGILMASWPGKETGYKTFRFHIWSERWPWIGPETLAQWRSGPELFIWLAPQKKKKRKFRIFLKAFHGAPCWTRDEMTKVVDAFHSVGITSIKSSMPSNKRMREVGTLGKIEK